MNDTIDIRIDGEDRKACVGFLERDRTNIWVFETIDKIERYAPTDVTSDTCIFCTLEGTPITRHNITDKHRDTISVKTMEILKEMECILPRTTCLGVQEQCYFTHKLTFDSKWVTEFTGTRKNDCQYAQIMITPGYETMIVSIDQERYNKLTEQNAPTKK